MKWVLQCVSYLPYPFIHMDFCVSQAGKRCAFELGLLETFEKCSILFKFKGNYPGRGNWTAVRLPDRAIPQDCGRVNAKI